MSSLLLLGDVVLDVSLKTDITPIKVRLGGIFHAVRGAWSLNGNFDLAYFAPEYLEQSIVKFNKNLSGNELIKLGNITGGPYLFLIQEVKEVGDQGYEFILKDEIEINYTGNKPVNAYEDALLISGNYTLENIVKALNAKAIHIDVANNVSDLSYFKSLNRKLATVFISTSSTLFKKYFKGDFIEFANLFKLYTQRLVLKENRGGTRAIDFTDGKIVSITSQTKPIVHSVGVGDVFDTCYVLLSKNHSFFEALTLASWIAMEYASTTFPDNFKRNVEAVLSIPIEEISRTQGVSLHWESRPSINIYLAAPDFTHVDTRHIEIVEEALKYHNFSPRRPVKEFGQLQPNDDRSRRQELFGKDMSLLNSCKIVVAVLLYNDPGTLIEIGLATGMGVPVIVYDPNKIASNCMLTELPRLVTTDLDEVISEVFNLSMKTND
ncbi:MAG TPA: nucleoside 2-deoxyribosyltransferase [Cyclobacteriaceae bacterium]|nr:nucleoside 2-deoxyribosyltransferase [Cyclobacteriaceae bacterium]